MNANEEMISFKELFNINKLHGKVKTLESEKEKLEKKLEKSNSDLQELKHVLYDYGEGMHCHTANEMGGFRVCYTCSKAKSKECSMGMAALRFMSEGEPRERETEDEYDWS